MAGDRTTQEAFLDPHLGEWEAERRSIAFDSSGRRSIPRIHRHESSGSARSRIARQDATQQRKLIATQTIYYPGFAIGGASEGLSMLAVLILLLLTPANIQAFWWTLAGLIGLAAMHAVYWTLTHPRNDPTQTSVFRHVCVSVFRPSVIVQPSAQERTGRRQTALAHAQRTRSFFRWSVSYSRRVRSARCRQSSRPGYTASTADLAEVNLVRRLCCGGGHRQQRLHSGSL